MRKNHDRSSGVKRGAEPVQVYLDGEERERLARLTSLLDTSKSDVLRRGLRALEHQVTDPGQHPALGVIGLAASELRGVEPTDAARDHDRVLADAEMETWGGHHPSPG